MSAVIRNTTRLMTCVLACVFLSAQAAWAGPAAGNRCKSVAVAGFSSQRLGEIPPVSMLDLAMRGKTFSKNEAESISFVDSILSSHYGMVRSLASLDPQAKKWTGRISRLVANNYVTSSHRLSHG